MCKKKWSIFAIYRFFPARLIYIYLYIERNSRKFAEIFLCYQSAQSAMRRNNGNIKIFCKCISITRGSYLRETLSSGGDDEFSARILFFSCGYEKYIIFFFDFSRWRVTDNLRIIFPSFFDKKCEEFSGVSTLKNQPSSVFLNDTDAIFFKKIYRIQIGKMRKERKESFRVLTKIITLRIDITIGNICSFSAREENFYSRIFIFLQNQFFSRFRSMNCTKKSGSTGSENNDIEKRYSLRACHVLNFNER